MTLAVWPQVTAAAACAPRRAAGTLVTDGRRYGKADAAAVIRSCQFVEHNNHPAAADATVDHGAHQGLLDDLMARVAPCSARRETRMTCRDMVHGLLTELEDHNCWTMGEAAAPGSASDAAPALPRPYR